MSVVFDGAAPPLVQASLRYPKPPIGAHVSRGLVAAGLSDARGNRRATESRRTYASRTIARRSSAEIAPSMSASQRRASVV
jgi:hypothetical protein